MKHNGNEINVSWTKDTPRIEKVADILTIDGKADWGRLVLDRAREDFFDKVDNATEAFVGKLHSVLLIPEDTIVKGLLVTSELATIGVYSGSDLITLYSGLRDLYKGNKLVDDKDKAIHRGIYKVVGAIAPVFPSSLILGHLDKNISVPSLDRKFNKISVLNRK